MSEQPSSGTDRCPECGDSAFHVHGGPGHYWCDNCEREFWREKSGWYSCSVEGIPQSVETETDQ